MAMLRLCATAFVLALFIGDAPVIKCEQDIVSALINKTDVKVVCVITANPPTSTPNITWMFKSPNGDIIFNSPYHTDRFRLESHSDNDGKRITQTLTFTRFSKTDLGKYHIHATNTLDSGMKSVTVTELTVPKGGSEVCRVCWSVLLVALVSAALRHLPLLKH